MKQKIFDFTLDRALMEAKSKNAKAVRALLNTEAITLDGETLIGLKDQLDKLKETDAYLFEGEQPGQGQQQQQTNNHSPGGTQRTNQKPPNNDAAYAAGTGTYRSEGNSLNKLK
ncbi:phage scaffolding protein [Domibacillus sp. PGB-M46]|nr:phage scaffolding protein [Domibacillus sp. PGB-M46]MCI2256507.1 phage scaffolding protein [Domibacillus sp. PGB-M46]